MIVRGCERSEHLRDQHTEFDYDKSGTLSLLNEDGVVRECTLEQEDGEFIVLNFTSVDLDCAKEKLTVFGEDRCHSRPPFCIQSVENCDVPSDYQHGCDRNKASCTLLHLKTVTQGHGLRLDYSFQQCDGYHGGYDDDGNSSFMTVFLPLIIAFAVVILFIIYVACVRHKQQRKAQSSTEFQQYVATVTSGNPVTPDMLSGSSLTLEFGRSYETVPRGTVPLHDICSSPARNPSNTANAQKQSSPAEKENDGGNRKQHSTFNCNNSYEVGESNHSRVAKEDAEYRQVDLSQGYTNAAFEMQ